MNRRSSTRGTLAALTSALALACTGGGDGAADAAPGTALDGGRSDAGAPPGVDGGSPGDARVVQEGDDAAAQGPDADAASPGEPTEAGALAEGCGALDVALCEDFEGAAPGALPAGWELLRAWGGGSDPAVVDDEHHSGRHALRTGVALNGQTRVARSLAPLGALAGHHWGRVFYKAIAPIALPPGGSVVHNTLVALRGADESRVVDTVIASSGAHQFLYNVPDDSVGIGTDYLYRSYDGDWHCAEWYVEAETQTFRFFFEGEEVRWTQGADQTPKLEAFRSIALGFINYQTPARAYDGYFDDLALGDARIGCTTSR